MKILEISKINISDSSRKINSWCQSFDTQPTELIFDNYVCSDISVFKTIVYIDHYHHIHYLFYHNCIISIIHIIYFYHSVRNYSTKRLFQIKTRNVKVAIHTRL